MKLDENVNYIISGLERSGTSMLMQIIKAADLPIAFDEESRPSDANNPRGYYELHGGKIINHLMEGKFPFNEYKGKFVKITSYGLKFLPPGKYKIIYSERNIEEILDSMEKMANIKDKDREETKHIFLKLNEMIKKQISERDDIDVLFISYNHIIKDPKYYITIIQKYLEIPDDLLNDMISIVDKKLYRQRKS